MQKNAKGMQMSIDWRQLPSGPATEALVDFPLLDHHVHGVVIENPSVDFFAGMMTESDRQPASLEDAMFSQVGYATRRWCAPLLDLEPHASPKEYFARRILLGADEVNSRFLKSSGIGHYFIETGYRGNEIHNPTGMAKLSGAKVDEIIRLETVVEQLALDGVEPTNFISDFQKRLAEVSKDAIGLKSILAYRTGLDVDPSRPSDTDVISAATKWLKEVEKSGKARVDDPILLRFLIWAGVDRNLPIQFHIGYGDPDLDLDRCDPLLMTGLIRELEKKKINVFLLHTYPFQRNAGYLAQMFDNVFLDVGLAINYSGARSREIIAESLELAPFKKILFSSDAWGLSELTFLGALLFRRGLGEVLDSFVARGDWSENDALAVVKAIGNQNALAAYNLNK